MRSRRPALKRNLTNLVAEIDRCLRVLDSKAASLQNCLVDACMQVGEPIAELDFVAVDVDRSERRFPADRWLERKIRAVARQEPSDVCAVEPDESAGALRLAHVDLVFDDGAEQPDQQ